MRPETRVRQLLLGLFKSFKNKIFTGRKKLLKEFKTLFERLLNAS
jgi:hypothetical protein